MGWHCYQTSYIDWGWAALRTVEETREILGKGGLGGKEYGYGTLEEYSVDEFDSAFENAKDMADSYGWEGDFRQGPVVFWIPDPDNNQFRYGFFWKQDNNGTCFTVSPVPMPWLED
ncbi:hypothetical protein LJR267_000172 [Paraburkholderia hospita]|uniref:hypothetical protein n=1 Tax=Paraburkholderia hospita TaxID=169430 RepID=UPI003ECFCD3C